MKGERSVGEGRGSRKQLEEGGLTEQAMRSPVPWHGRNDDRQLLERSGGESRKKEEPEKREETRKQKFGRTLPLEGI